MARNVGFFLTRFAAVHLWGDHGAATWPPHRSSSPAQDVAAREAAEHHGGSLKPPLDSGARHSNGVSLAEASFMAKPVPAEWDTWIFSRDGPDT